MKDVNGVEIREGDRLRHTGHGEICLVCAPGTDDLLASHDGLILIPENLPYRYAWALTEKRAAKGEVVHEQAR